MANNTKIIILNTNETLLYSSTGIRQVSTPA